MDAKPGIDAIKTDSIKDSYDPGPRTSSNISFREDNLTKLAVLNLEKALVKAMHEQFWPEGDNGRHKWIDQTVLLKDTEESKNIRKAADGKSEKEGKEPGEDALLENGEVDRESHDPIAASGFWGYRAFSSDEYIRHSEMYTQFMGRYLYATTDALFGGAARNDQDYLTALSGEILRAPKDELISHKEKKEYIQAIMMNALLGAPMNHVDPKLKDRYEAWKMSSKFYQQLSFIYYDSVLSQ